MVQKIRSQFEQKKALGNKTKSSDHGKQSKAFRRQKNFYFKRI